MCQGARGAFTRMPLSSLLFLHCNGACQHCSVSMPLRVSQQRLSTHLGACGLLLPDLSHLGGKAGRHGGSGLWRQIVAADWQVLRRHLLAVVVAVAPTPGVDLPHA